jgi:hypothetical protein
LARGSLGNFFSRDPRAKKGVYLSGKGYPSPENQIPRVKRWGNPILFHFSQKIRNFWKNYSFHLKITPTPCFYPEPHL